MSSYFVSSPNLPINAETVIIGEKYANILKYPLKKLELNPIFIPDNPHVDPRLAGHADLSIFHAGGERVYLAPYLKNSNFAKKILKLGADIVFPDICQAKTYPHDAQLNLAYAGKNLIFCKNISENSIVDYLTIDRGITPINIKQGYSKCSALVVDGRSIITADKGIASAAKSAGLDVLEICTGYVELDGFDYGFIGGAGFKASESTMAFTGILDMHPEKDGILDFLEKHGVKPVFLTDKPIFDIGGVIPLTEKG